MEDLSADHSRPKTYSLNVMVYAREEVSEQVIETQTEYERMTPEGSDESIFGMQCQQNTGCHHYNTTSFGNIETA